MSITSESSENPQFEEFKDNVTNFLEKAFLAFAALFLIAGMNYLAFVPQNVQNTMPMLLVLFLGTYTWIMRAKVLQTQPEHLRAYIYQWVIVCVLVIIVTIIAIVLYPYSNFNVT